MTVDVTIVNRKPNDILEMVYNLRNSGLVQGKDFEFRIDYEIQDFISKPYAVFSFHNEKYSTFFALKNSEYVQR